MDVDDHLARADEVDVEQREPLDALEVGEPGFDRERLAEDAGRLGQRHRHPLLQRRATGQRGVVVGVAELVGRGLGRVDRARPVEQHERTVVDELHAERPAHLAVARAGVDPPLVERPVDEAGELAAVARERRADPRDAVVPRDRRGRLRDRCHEVAPAQPARRTRAPCALVRIQRRKSGSDVDDRGVHRVERRPADAVRVQRRVERGLPVAAAVDDVGLALDRVHRGRDRGGDGGPRRHLGAVAPPRAPLGRVTDARPRTAGIGIRSMRPSGNCTSVASCEVTSWWSRYHADEPVVCSSA